MSIGAATRQSRRFPPAKAIATLILASLLCGGSGEAQQGRVQEPGERTHQPLRPTELSPRFGPPGTAVTVTAGLLPAITPVQLAIGATRSGFEGLALTLTDPNGALVETVTVPQWARRDQIHRFILFNLYFTAVYAESGIFHVTDADGRVVREGVLGSSGAACPTLAGDDGEHYRLGGGTEGLQPGARAVVEAILSESNEGCGDEVSLGLEIISIRRAGGAEGAGVPQARPPEPIVGLPCEGCEAVFQGLPEELTSRTRLAPVDEPGEPLVIEGVVSDGAGRPAPGAIVYAYHTDARGIYPPDERFPGQAAYRHGRLRGWAMTDANGRYRFDTIRPASYPDTEVAAHVHMHVIEPGCCTYYIAEINFADDPRLSARERAEHADARGGSGLVEPQRSAGSVWMARRDIVLGLRVPGYPGGGLRVPGYPGRYVLNIDRLRPGAPTAR